MIKISRWPVIIIANYRTASSPLLNSIEEEYGLAGSAFIEPTSSSNKLEPFLNCYHSGNKRYALKIIVDQTDDIVEYQELLASDCFKVRLIREDEINQIVSYYIAKKRNIWFQRPWETVGEYLIDIDDEDINLCIDTICNNNQVLLNFSASFDVTCTHKSLGYLDNSKTTTYTTMPINFNDIKRRIEYLYAHR